MARYVSQSVLVCSFCCNTSTEGRGRIWEITQTYDNQNSAARIVPKKRKRARPYNTYPLLNELHWLPVTFRLEYKVAIFAYRHLDSKVAFTLFYFSASHILNITHPPIVKREAFEKFLNVITLFEIYSSSLFVFRRSIRPEFATSPTAACLQNLLTLI